MVVTNMRNLFMKHSIKKSAFLAGTIFMALSISGCKFFGKKDNNNDTDPPKEDEP